MGGNTVIYVTDIRHLPAHSESFESWAIVRYWRGRDDDIWHMPDLSPSSALFLQYRELVNENNWNAKTFRKIYVPWFIREMRQQYARDALNKLYQLDRQGKKVALACFCKDETLCHRSIIVGLLQGAGANVMTDTGLDYSNYYELYKTLP